MEFQTKLSGNDIVTESLSSYFDTCKKQIFAYAKTKAQISCAVTDQHLCFRYSDSRILLLIIAEIPSL